MVTEGVVLMGLEQEVLAKITHMMSNMSERVYICAKCDNIKFEKHNHVYEALYYVKKPFSCSVCDYRCNQLSNSYNLGKNEFSCVYSDNSWKSLNEGDHTGEKPIQCLKGDFRSSQLDKVGHTKYRLCYTCGNIFICFYRENERNILYTVLHTGRILFIYVFSMTTL